jgi:hypothetical protein
MTGSIYGPDGRMVIPEPLKTRSIAPGESMVVNAVYCPRGHNMVSIEHEISGFPGILLRFKGSQGEGLIALSAVLGDPARMIVQGTVPEEEPVTLSCHVCGTPLDVLGDCRCVEGAVSVLAYLYPRRDPYQAIAFCNSLSCDNSAVIRSGEAIRNQSDTPWQTS